MKDILKHCNFSYLRYLFFQALIFASFVFALHFILISPQKNYPLAVFLFVVGIVAVFLQHKNPKPKLATCLEDASMAVSVVFPVVLVSGFALVFSAFFAKELVFDSLYIGSIAGVLLFGCIVFYFWQCKRKINDIK